MYLATSILRVFSLSHAIEKKRARDRSLQEPGFGLAEDREGVVMGLKLARAEVDGVVVEMEVRRKSGRGVREVFVLFPSASSSRPVEGVAKVSPGSGRFCLLDDHPLYSHSVEEEGEGGDHGAEEDPETTFSLGLTEKQRKDREGIVLPYFDAQNDGGGGEGGRILYEMGREDDWDPEEDEI